MKNLQSIFVRICLGVIQPMLIDTGADVFSNLAWRKREAAGRKIVVLLLLLAIFAPASLLAGTYTWSGASPLNANVTTAGNWIDPNGNVAATRPSSGDNLYFGAANRYNITLNSGSLLGAIWTFDSIESYTFLKPGSPYVLQFAEYPAVSLTQNGIGDVNFNALFRFNGQRVVTGGADSGSVNFNNDLLVNPNGGQAGGLTLQGSVMVQINGTQAAGATTTNSWRLNGGGVVLGGTGALSVPVENSLAANHGADGATIAPGVDGVAGTLTLAGGLTLQRKTNLNFRLGGNSGGNDLIHVTGGTLSLSGTGPFVINLDDLGQEPVGSSPITLIQTDAGVTKDLAGLGSASFTIGALAPGFGLVPGYGDYGPGGVFDLDANGNLSVKVVLQSLQVVGSGKMPVIVVPPARSYAPLRDGIAACTGVTPTIKIQTTYTPLAGEVPIYVGDTPFIQGALGTDLINSIDVEGYIIKVEATRIFIYARDAMTNTGTPLVWAENDFLRRFLGVDWYFPGSLGTVFPTSAGLAIPLGTRVQSPVFLHRQMSGNPGGTPGFPAGFRLRASGGPGRFPFHHNLYNLVPIDTYWSSHPEYYPVVYNNDPASQAGVSKAFYNGLNVLPGNNPYVPGSRFVASTHLVTNLKVSPPADYLTTNWQPCPSNPDVVNIVTDNVIAAMAANPYGHTASLGINDNDGFCRCPLCISAMAGSGFGSDQYYSSEAEAYRMYKLYNSVAEAVVAQPPYSDARLGFLAYSSMGDWAPPTLHPALMPYLTMSMADCSDPAYKASLYSQFQFWGHPRSAHFGVYDYLYGNGFIIPRIYLHDEADGLSVLARLGCQGFYSETYPNWGLDGPKLWVIEQLLWNPYQNVDGLINRWCNGLFGPAGPAMADYFDYLESVWCTQKPLIAPQGGYALWGIGYKNAQLGSIFSPTACQNALNLLATAQSQTNAPDQLARIQYFKSAFSLTNYLSNRNAAAQTAAGVSGSITSTTSPGMATAINAYAQWLAVGSIDDVLDDIATNAPTAFYEQLTAGNDWRKALKQWDSDFPVVTTMAQVVVDRAISNLGTPIASRAALDSEIANIVNGLTINTAVRTALSNIAKGMVLTVTNTTASPALNVPSALNGAIGSDWGTPVLSGSFYVYPSLSIQSTKTSQLWVRYDAQNIYVAGHFVEPAASFNSAPIGRDNVPLNADQSLNISNYTQTFNYMYPSPVPLKQVVSCNSLGMTLPTYTLSLITAEGSLFDAYSGSTGYVPLAWNGASGVAWKTADGWSCQMIIPKSPTAQYPGASGTVKKGYNFFRVSANSKTAWVPGIPSVWSIDPRSVGYLYFQ